MQINKSLLTNLISVGLAVGGFLIPSENPLAGPIRDIGLYATSGAITNWIAIYMLFEKVPGFYGSGVIPNRFEEFKSGIRAMVMQQFFNRENVSQFFQSQQKSMDWELDPNPILEVIDFDAMFAKLQDAVMKSPLGGMLAMFGGPKALEGMRAPFQANMEEELRKLIVSPKLHEALQKSVKTPDLTDDILDKVQQIVSKRLDELTPAMVKQIVQDMIRQHLGWLVVWGGVFGGLIGLAASLLRLVA
ncbi:hypothetical protein VN12_21750 [Pirellula sp. SH-Sr6A]|uniref:hypothetical protein n=1 Tax=Pirellula sp. SH-Sr6A TaxID=1632865 RepID=UPI00078BFE3B|nr:hypothetical protein [Pirellula sp. SH-Sr6A]AMV34766.1 hypothetical protein VN12_21750 [Pirellula sp. SH-Sr6A]